MLLVALQLVLLHTVDGRPVYVNAAVVTSLAAPRAASDPRSLLAGEVHCVIHMHNGRFVSVIETCHEVYQKLHSLP